MIYKFQYILIGIRIFEGITSKMNMQISNYLQFPQKNSILNFFAQKLIFALKSTIFPARF